MGRLGARASCKEEEKEEEKEKKIEKYFVGLTIPIEVSIGYVILHVDWGWKGKYGLRVIVVR